MATVAGRIDRAPGWTMPRVSDATVLGAVLLLATALRLAAIPGAGFAHQDELFQYLEQAHRLVFGTGVIPWEYRYGMRGWLLPLLLAAPMKLGGAIAPGTMLYLVLPRAALSAMSLATVAGAWAIGRRQSRVHAVLAGFAAAIWPELVNFAPHALGEPIATSLIVAGAALVTTDDPRRLVVAGLLLGIGALLRFQYLPAIGALALIATWHRRATWPALAAGAAIALWIGASIDLANGQAPFGWIVANLRENLIHARALRYGSAGPLAYVAVLHAMWGGWLPPLLILATIGARRQPALAAAALVNLALHMAVGHKEYRFILLTTTLTVLLAAIGSGELVAWLRQRRPDLARAAPWLALAGWAGIATTLAASGRAQQFDVPASPARALYAGLAHDPGLCGIATWRISFADAGGYTLLHRAVPMFLYAAGERAALVREGAAFNRLVAPDAPPPPGFVRERCASGGAGYAPACVFRRTGGCAPLATGHAINRALIRIDQ